MKEEAEYGYGEVRIGEVELEKEELKKVLLSHMGFLMDLSEAVEKE